MNSRRKVPPEAAHIEAVRFARIIGAGERPEVQPVQPIEIAAEPPAPAIATIARVNGQTVSLGVKMESPPQVVLLLLLGQQQLRNNISVAGSQIMDGLRASGHRITRTDTILKRLAAAGNVVATGKRKRLRYRLTKDGVENAQAIAAALAAPLPQESN